MLPLIKATETEIIKPIKKTAIKDITDKVNACQGKTSKCATSRCFLIFSSSFSETFNLIKLPRLRHHLSYLFKSGAISSLNLVYSLL